MILLIIASILLIAVVFIQNPKGGGINDFGASTQIGGVQRTTDFIEKATWGLAMALILLSVLMAPKSSMTPTTTEESGSIAKKKAQSAVAIPQQQAPAAQPAAPVEQPK